ncbi:hypothetical protein BRADI_5g25676v3 [Brachypodium distachyon]|uniref:Uncharacterized protein n=1 Tax=Brachypodium distachyon TaxID=15368 RepID=A0A2K2CJ91_BRADI|nr:hypothetical protein BRADI_5g25676v3 [Brachypodium distachyon]
MERNAWEKSGKCGIAMAASYPVKTTPNPPKPAPAREPETMTKCDRHSTCPAAAALALVLHGRQRALCPPVHVPRQRRNLEPAGASVVPVSRPRRCHWKWGWRC